MIPFLLLACRPTPDPLGVEVWQLKFTEASGEGMWFGPFGEPVPGNDAESPLRVAFGVTSTGGDSCMPRACHYCGLLQATESLEADGTARPQHAYAKSLLIGNGALLVAPCVVECDAGGGGGGSMPAFTESVRVTPEGYIAEVTGGGRSFRGRAVHGGSASLALMDELARSVALGCAYKQAAMEDHSQSIWIDGLWVSGEKLRVMTADAHLWVSPDEELDAREGVIDLFESYDSLMRMVGWYHCG